jgi:glutathione S-transferase
VRYLCRKHGTGTLWPADPRAAADADRWMDWQATTANPALFGAFFNLVRAEPHQRDQAAIDASLAKSEQMMAILDAHLATQPWVAGAAYSMGDIPIACTVHRWFGLPVDKARRPSLEDWLARIRARPAYAGVLTLPIT